MSFHVGQKVICVNGVFKHPSWRFVINRPVQGRIYTVREVVPGWFKTGHGGLRLEEVLNDRIPWGGGELSEAAFWLDRFRPVVERKTDISIFTAMLDGVKQGEKV